MSGHDHSHAHHHDHDHSHGFGHHHEPPQIDHLNAAFIWGIILNSLFVVIEVIAGLITGSLSLMVNGNELGSLAPGKTFSFTADKAGTVSYVCTFHPGMQGTLEVG